MYLLQQFRDAAVAAAITAAPTANAKSRTSILLVYPPATAARVGQTFLSVPPAATGQAEMVSVPDASSGDNSAPASAAASQAGGTPVPLSQPLSAAAATFLSQLPARRAAAILVLLTALATFGFLSVAPNANACGMPTSLPSSPFLGHEDYRFSYWESWGQLKISPTVTLQIPVGFSPVPNHQNSRFLGRGWSFPLLESTCFPINDREYEMLFPSGHRERLRKTKTPNRLSGSNWLAQVSGPTITAKSPCNWTLVFQNGRLQRLRTPDGGLVEFSRALDGSYRINVNGALVLTYKPDFDPATTQPIAILTVKNNNKSGQEPKENRRALLRFDHRPAIVESMETTKTGATAKDKRETRTQTLSSVKWDGKPARIYSFKNQELLAGNDVFHWDNGNLLTQHNGKTYSFPVICGVKCIKVLNAKENISSVTGCSKDGTHVVSSGKDGTLYLYERLLYEPDPKEMTFLVRQISRIEANGSLSMVRKCQFDIDGTPIRVLTREDGVETTSLPKQGIIEARNEKTKELLWKKRFDDQGRLLELETKGLIYKIEYLKDRKVRLTKENNGQTLSFHLPETALTKILNF